MIRVLMICHGNICRSPMAEFVLKDLIQKRHLESKIQVASGATSTEEIGCAVHRGTRQKLAEHGISCEGKFAVQVRKADYALYDYLIVMDDRNLKNLERIIGPDSEQKVYKLLSFANDSGDIADPWYTGDFESTYQDVYRGCTGLLDYLVTRQY